MLKAVIVDDEPLARDELAYLLKRTKKVEIVAESDTLSAVFDERQPLEADVLFLDIELAEDNGIEIAKKLSKMDNRPEIVFATAYDEFALEAFELNALDYLLKPFDEHRVIQTVNKLERIVEMKKASRRADAASARTGEAPKKLAINLDEKIIVLNPQDIYSLEAAGGQTIITAQDKKYRVNESLISLERKLRDTTIERVHRSYLVNLDKVAQIEPWFHSTYLLVLPNGEKIPVSRTYAKKLKQWFGL
ncbi:LytR/AlgR family response regulator transcription factor [Caenibacillus caldisaponilyticus]|uniref:LytR/AlgR family response regulator transcription factor n=1 Tax=Caenibacillus caldisaponilyticus TaxID=1674942 RepID=UPI0009884EE9|nr:LytTR family transcriptional regulator DNA-binding domain-containing protein [Caenibacillus caldisaponilyticus]